MLILDGKKVADEINGNLKKKIAAAVETVGSPPGLATILVGDNPASKVYIGMKAKKCAELGIKSFNYTFPADISRDELVDFIERLNKDDRIHGILLQLPLPAGLKKYTFEITEHILPEKDVDGFTSVNMGKLLLNSGELVSCTPKGILRLLDHYSIPIRGKNVVIVNHSIVIGKPLSLLFLNRNATVTVCHEFTRNIDFYLKNAEILVVGVGIRNFITADRISKGCILVDAGINRDENGKLCGDADFEGVKDICAAITPVPGGVGPMTIAMLMENTYLAYRKITGYSEN